MKMTRTLAAAMLAVAFALAASAAAARQPPQGSGEKGAREAGNQEAAPAAGPYVPGLGEIMGGIQLRHAKLWFAGKARNWALAAYELGEIREAFGDAAKYQPNFKGRPVAQMIEPITDEALAALERAIAAKDAAQFAKAYDKLSGACNACHEGARYGFIVIQRPAAPPLTNQRFEAPARR